MTERDVMWLAWLGRWRALTARQVGAWGPTGDLPTATKVAERRLRTLAGFELVESEVVLAGIPALWRLTAKGMKFVGVRPTKYHPSVATIQHDLAVADCALWLWRSRGGKDTLLTEREIRAIDAPTSMSPRLALLADQKMAGRRLLYPDLLMRTPEGKILAHEVEIAPKQHSRMVAIMTAYVQADHIARVRYYTEPGAVFGRLQRAADEANAAAARWGREKTVFVAERLWETENVA